MALKNESSKNKSSLLERWLNLNKTQETRKGITRLPSDQLAPLSSGQQRLWFLQQLYPQNSFYNYTEAYRFQGKLHMENLMQSFRLVAARHNVLRTTVQIKDGEAIQLTKDTVKPDIANIDLSHLPTEQREKDMQVVAFNEASRTFDLNQGPLSRISFIRLADNDHLVVITMHHIITDEWSMGILRDELAYFYTTLQAGNTPSLEPLSIQYTDYSYWQKANQVDPKHLEYWKGKLQGEIPVLKLPTDHPRPAIPSFAGGFYTQSFPAALSTQIKNLARQTNTTMFVFLLTVYKVLLYRYSGQGDMLIGTPFNSRDQVSLEKLIGFFIDTLVLRSNLSGDTRFIDLLTQVRQTSMEAFSHKDLPFETLVRELKPDRYMSANPLFQVMFVYHKVPSVPSFGSDLTMELTPFDSGVAKFDLTLHIAEENDHLSATFEYARDMFELPSIKRMQDHLKVLLEGIVENPEAAITDLPLLTKAESHQILTDWNNIRITFDDGFLIHQLFEQRVLEKPNEPAVAFQGMRLTYSELNEKSNSVAAYIHKKGVGSHSLVGLYTERSLDLIVGILGILKAGCAYLPLDPEYPAERIHFMLQDARVQVILTQAHLTSGLSETDVPLLTFEQAIMQTREPVSNLVNEISESDLAYVIYTSGSTGQPKGVPITHGNLLNSTLARSEYYPEPPKTFLLLSSFAFDSSVAGIFWTLSAGGLLVLSEKHIEQDINQLADLISSHQVTQMLLLPSLYTLLLQHARLESLISLKSVIVAGEACMSSLYRLHTGILENTDLYNEYGPTEATVWCTAHRLTKEDADGLVPIGNPIANTQIYILDQWLHPVPAGITGELYVAGAGLAQGYLNGSEFSATRFLPNPFSNDPTEKIYKTGDLAGYRPDGLIEFLGRADDQVKIRGFRIELSEINETLKQLEGIHDATVLVHKESNTSLTDDSITSATESLIASLKNMDEEEAIGILRSVETLSETELDYMLDEINK